MTAPTWPPNYRPGDFLDEPDPVWRRPILEFIGDHSRWCVCVGHDYDWELSGNAMHWTPAEDEEGAA